ncbi:hypothetical protein [Streptomyces sp. TRM64462]|uniref:hypothetical protein n=1 Tax=Streptomyces sp. TRM64462 TaxID=2741726 RepID=UPI0015866ACF|nr:hypothetical protein [Streptomyces sp. TRM64462]
MNPDTPGRVPVALYVAAGDAPTVDLLSDYCRQYATARDWDAVEAVTDTDRLIPLVSRPGWARVLSLLATGTVRGVVTYSPAMLAAIEGGYDAVRALLSEQGAFLAATRRPDLAPEAPPRRTPAQRVRRQGLADAAYGSDWRPAR